MEAQHGATGRFSPRASLAAIGLRLRELELLDLFAQKVKIPQKKVKAASATQPTRQVN
jgi:hypothetical protein